MTSQSSREDRCSKSRMVERPMETRGSSFCTTLVDSRGSELLRVRSRCFQKTIDILVALENLPQLDSLEIDFLRSE